MSRYPSHSPCCLPACRSRPANCQPRQPVVPTCARRRCPPLYHASKLGQDPQATAQALFKNIPPAEADKRYEVVVSVRELPPQPIRLQPAAAPLKGQ